MMKIKILVAVALLSVLISCKKKELETNEYYPSGKLWRKTVYASEKDMDKNYILYEFYENGSIQSVSNYENSMMQGRSLSFYQNGSMQSVFFYDKGKLNTIGRYFDNSGKLTDKGLFINDSLVVKEEVLYQGNYAQLNAYEKINGEFRQTGSLLYDDKNRLGLDHSNYYLVTSADSIPLKDSLQVQISFITKNRTNSHIALSLGRIDENLEFLTKDKTYIGDSLGLSFYFKPSKAGYNLITGKLLLITGAPKERLKNLFFITIF
jgi:hypothetical protein